MTRIKSLRRCSLLASLALLAGCVTPPEVKQALVSLYQGYADNASLMKQYQKLTQGYDDRTRYWTLYVKNRNELDMALIWATTDAQRPGITPEDYADETRTLLGPNVMKLVNQVRLAGLPARTGTNATDLVFEQGSCDINKLIQGLPALVNEITRHTAAEYDATVVHSSTPFDDYNAKVAALRRMNDAVKRYLNIDVTVKPADVKDIADSVKTLAGK